MLSINIRRGLPRARALPLLLAVATLAACNASTTSPRMHLPACASVDPAVYTGANALPAPLLHSGFQTRVLLVPRALVVNPVTSYSAQLVCDFYRAGWTVVDVDEAVQSADAIGDLLAVLRTESRLAVDVPSRAQLNSTSTALLFVQAKGYHYTMWSSALQSLQARVFLFMDDVLGPTGMDALAVCHFAKVEKACLPGPCTVTDNTRSH
jgi:hypothetical protein